MNFNKLTFGLVALVATGLFLTLNAFVPGEARRTNSYWAFTSQDISDARVAAHYSLITEPLEAPCEEGSTMPCVLELPESIDTPQELKDHLENKTLFPDDEAVTRSAKYKKD